MSITVTCPKCGRNIKAKKKFVLNTGGVPCLKCKVRIPVSREQVEALDAKGADAEETAAATAETPAAAVDQVSEPTLPQGEATTPAIEEPAVVPVAEEQPAVAEPPVAAEPPAPETPAAERVQTPEFPQDETETITAAIATEPGAEPEQTETPTAAGTQAGPHVIFTCAYCQNSYPVKQGLAGKKIRCKGCSRIVKVAADSPVVPVNEPPPPPPPPPREEDDIPVVYSTGAAPAPAPVAAPPPPPPPPSPSSSAPAIPETGDAHETITRLKQALVAAEERASSAEEMLQRTNLDKLNNEMTAFRKIRDLESQLRELTTKLKLQESAAGTMKRADVEALLKALCDELDANLEHELAARRSLFEDLKRQLNQAMQ